MTLEISQIGPEGWDSYARIPTDFLVRSVLACELLEGGMGGITLRETAVESPYTKQFDADDLPANWANSSDLKTWGVFLAIDAGRPVGGAAVAPPLC